MISGSLRALYGASAPASWRAILRLPFVAGFVVNQASGQRLGWCPEILLPLIPALLLTACAALREPAPGQTPEQMWRQRQQALGALRNWSITGRIALRAEQQAWHASLHWQQRGDYYQIRIRGPLGFGVMELSGGPEGVVMRTSDHRRFAAQAPEELLLSVVGWTMPVAGLQYWLLGGLERGVPITTFELDVAGRLEALRQSGWAIQYLAYRKVGSLDLPTKLFLENQRVSARIVVNRWILES